MSAKTKCAESFRLNDRVFAKMKSYPIWPAKIIEILDNDKYKVFFYGTHDCAVVPLSNVTKYEKLKNNIPKSKLKAYPSAVKEIKQDVNNKLFSCEKIKKYQKNLANKNKARNVKTKNESNDTNNKKRKIVTNSISDKGAPSKKAKKNQKSVDFSIFTASELYLECSTPDNIPVRMHISDVLTKDILSTLPDYDKDPIKWKSFVLCIVDFIRCKIIKGEPVPHEVQTNIDVIIQNNKSLMSASSTEKKRSNSIEATSTCLDTKENIKKLRKRSQGSAESAKGSKHLLEITPDKIKKEIGGEEKEEVINGGEKDQGEKDIEDKENDLLTKEVEDEEKEDLNKIQNDSEQITFKENGKEMEFHTVAVQEISTAVHESSSAIQETSIAAQETGTAVQETGTAVQETSTAIPETNTSVQDTFTKADVETHTEPDTESDTKPEKESNEKSNAESDKLEASEKSAKTSATDEIIQRQSPLLKNEKLLAKYMNYFSKRKLKLDLTEINHMLKSKQELNKSELTNSHESGRENGSLKTTVNEPSSKDDEPKKSRVDIPKKVTNDPIQTHQSSDYTNNNTHSDLIDKTSDFLITNVPNKEVSSNLANSSCNTSSSYPANNQADTTLSNNVNVNVTTSSYSNINKEIDSTDSIQTNFGECHEPHKNEVPTPENERKLYTETKNITENHITIIVANSQANSKENTFCNETNKLCQDTIEELLKTNMCYEKQPHTKESQFTSAPVETVHHFNVETNIDANSMHADVVNGSNKLHASHTTVGSSSKPHLEYGAYSNVEHTNAYQYIVPTPIEDISSANPTSDLSESQLNDLVHELFQQECQALSLHVRLMQCLSFNKNQQSFCSEADLLNAVQILADLYHMRLNQFVLLRNPQLVFTCRLIAKCSRDFVDRNNNTNIPPSVIPTTSDKKSPDTRLSYCHYHARTLETTAIRFLQYVQSVFDFKSDLNFYDQFNLSLAKFHRETKNMTWADMIYLAEQCIRNNIW